MLTSAELEGIITIRQIQRVNRVLVWRIWDRILPIDVLVRPSLPDVELFLEWWNTFDQNRLAALKVIIFSRLVSSYFIPS